MLKNSYFATKIKIPEEKENDKFNSEAFHTRPIIKNFDKI
jgi:hypothetical protein